MRIFDEQLDRLLELIIEAEDETRFKSAVGIVQWKDKWLLGLSTATDDRENKWCFPGGRIERGESPKQAAVREVFEETGIRCKTIDDLVKHSSKPNVAFYHCKLTRQDQKFDLSNEFKALGWFKLSDMRGLKLHNNVKQLISKVS
jgi:8-oxo-dGTP pyrophosphatase MutT (NUDIX family)